MKFNYERCDADQVARFTIEIENKDYARMDTDPTAAESAVAEIVDRRGAPISVQLLNLAAIARRIERKCGSKLLPLSFTGAEYG